MVSSESGEKYAQIKHRLQAETNMSVNVRDNRRWTFFTGENDGLGQKQWFKVPGFILTNMQFFSSQDVD